MRGGKGLSYGLQSFRARTEAEALRGLCLLACFLWLVQLSSLYNMSRAGTTHQGLGLPTLIMNQENAPSRATGQSNGGQSSVKVSFASWHWWCQGDRTKQHGHLCWSVQTPLPPSSLSACRAWAPRPPSTHQVPAFPFFLLSRIHHHSPPWPPPYQSHPLLSTADSQWRV